MVFITGDIHGNPTRIVNVARNQDLTKDDVIVILGDVGANYYRGQRDKMMKQALAELAPTILCVHGNHEARPTSIPGYKQRDWRGGIVWYQPQYPNLLFAKDGEIIQLDSYYLPFSGNISYRLSAFCLIYNHLLWRGQHLICVRVAFRQAQASQQQDGVDL